MVKYVSTYTKGTHKKNKNKKKKKKKQQRTYLMMLILCFVFFFLIFVIKAYVVGTQLNCIDKSMQFKWVPTTYAFI